MSLGDSVSGMPAQRGRKAALRWVVGFLLLGMATVEGPAHSAAGLRSLGLFLLFLGVLGRLWCTLYIGGRKFRQVVQTGPFSVNRNPLYMFSLVATLGAALQSGSAMFAAAAGLLYLIVIDAAVRREETALLDRFGSAYADYCRRVPRYGVRMSVWQDAGAVAFSPRLLYRTAADGALFFALVPLAEIYARMQAAGILPVLLTPPL